MLAERAVQRRVGMVSIAEQIRRFQQPHLLDQGGGRAHRADAHVEGAVGDRLGHLRLVAQRAIRHDVHGQPPFAPLCQGRGEPDRAGMNNGVSCVVVTEAQAAGSGACHMRGREKASCGREDGATV